MMMMMNLDQKLTLDIRQYDVWRSYSRYDFSAVGQLFPMIINILIFCSTAICASTSIWHHSIYNFNYICCGISASAGSDASQLFLAIRRHISMINELIEDIIIKAVGYFLPRLTSYSASYLAQSWYRICWFLDDSIFILVPFFHLFLPPSKGLRGVHDGYAWCCESYPDYADPMFHSLKYKYAPRWLSAGQMLGQLKTIP